MQLHINFAAGIIAKTKNILDIDSSSGVIDLERLTTIVLARN